MTRPLIVAALMATVSLGACAVGPNYRTPTAPTETVFREAKDWTPSQPMDTLDRGAWWSAFHDPALDGLEQRLGAANQTLAAQEAAYRQATAALSATQSSLFPQVGATLGGQKSGTDQSGSTDVTRYNGGLSASWSFDLWGKVRRQIEASRADAQMSAADLANVKLSLQATLASTYFQLRAAEALEAALTTTAANYSRALAITQNQYKVGVAARADLFSAQSQLASATASLADARQSSAQLRHALAALVGQTPDQFELAAGALPTTVPVAPLDLASTLLQRRPDIASAERSVAAASAGIGVAQAAWFPSLTLSASDSSTAAKIGDLFKAGASSWAYGATAAETLIDFGARRAAVRSAKALYDQKVALYRQTVLSAFQETEDQIVALRQLQTSVAQREQAADFAAKAETIALNQYKSGLTGYSAVITAQNASLSAQQSLITARRSQLVASVGLIQALGGGWTAK
jgi:NodT family efflux transporter outer membrane factor (OMF) lipoprotein